MNPGYTPSQAHGVANPNPRGNIPMGYVAWYATPPTSHIARFRYLDARIYQYLGDLPGGKLLPAGSSLLYVIFRDEQGNLSNTFCYGFGDAAEGQRVTDAMDKSAHPYGEVLVPQVIKKGVPYTQV